MATRLMKDALLSYLPIISNKLTSRPFAILGLCGISSVFLGMNASFAPGALICLCLSVVLILLLVYDHDHFIGSKYTNYSDETNYRESIRTVNVCVAVISVLILLYGFTFTYANKQKSYDFMERHLVEGDYDQTYSGYIVQAPIKKDENKYYTYVLETEERVLISFYSSLPQLKTGDQVEIAGRLTEHMGPRNPGGFDSFSYFSSDGIYLKLSTSNSKIHINEENYRRPGILYMLSLEFGGLRNKIFSNWRSVMSEEDASMLNAMILGDKTELSNEVRDRFRNSNLSHLIAVSGLHVSSYLVPVISCLRLTGKRRVRQILIFASLVFFGFLTGWTASVSRAVIMCIYSVLASAVNRRCDPFSGLFASSVLLFMIDPYIVADMAFQLSFGATFSILLTSDRLTNRMSRWIPRICAQPIATMISAYVGMLSVLVVIGSKQSFILMVVSIIGTIISQGICILVIPITFVFIVLTAVFRVDGLFSVLFTPVRGLLYLLQNISKVGEFDSVSALRLERVAPFLLAGSIVLAIAISMKRSTARRVVAFIAIFCISIGLANQTYAYFDRPIATIVFLDVGQGDSTLIMYQRKSVIIDGGESEKCEKVLIPALNYYGIRMPDIAIMSHLHSDHGGGLLELVDKNRVDRIAVPFFGEGDDYAKLIEGHDVAGLFYVLKSQDRIELSEDVCLSVLHPAQQTEKGGNEDSLIILLTISQTGILFMGDAGFVTEERLLNDENTRSLLSENIDIIKVGHHGSKYSSSEEFLSVLSPQASVICVGPNFYGHPTSETIARLGDVKADVFRTDRDGAIILEIYEDEARIITMLQ
ncbi:MAG: DNA internalization-related competence protein ComEC/Rec2 [Clostridiales bacterium]|nr:DNA internalization-related competence protein ComEC/Rec2 [Clostridiales bacterium]